MTRLVFLPAEPTAPLEWLRLGASGVVTRGAGAPAPDEAGDETLVAVAPADAVSLRWIDLPAGLSPPQAAAAARLAAAGLAAEPAEALHVALADAADDSGRRLVAIARLDAVAGWLDRLAADGLSAQRLLPAPMLLPHTADAPWTGVVRNGLMWVRGPGQAFAAEPEVAHAITGEPPHLLDAAAFEAALPDALATAQPDLLQGRFARRTPFSPDWARLRRIAGLAAAVALAVAAADVARGWRAAVAADTARAQAVALARPLLPAGARATDPVAQLAALGGSGGPGAGFVDMAAALFAAARDSEGAMLDSLEHSADGRLRAGLAAPSVAGLAGVESRLDGLGFEATLGPVRSDGGRQRAELTVRGRP
jgi:general secretion pathway protein L